MSSEFLPPDAPVGGDPTSVAVDDPWMWAAMRAARHHIDAEAQTTLRQAIVAAAARKRPAAPTRRG